MRPGTPQHIVEEFGPIANVTVEEREDGSTAFVFSFDAWLGEGYFTSELSFPAGYVGTTPLTVGLFARHFHAVINENDFFIQSGGQQADKIRYNEFLTERLNAI